MPCSKVGNRWMALVAPAVVFAVTACGDTPAPPDPGTDNNAVVLDNLANAVILDTYQALDANAAALVAAVATLAAAPTDAALTAARQAWRDTRVPWEQSEGFLFGPVDTEGIDPAIDSWPVNQQDLDAVLASGTPLTKTFIDGLEGTLKGFHTIEYLLWGSGGKTAVQLTPRELEYLTAVTASLRGATQQLATAWSPSGGNFAGQLSVAGNGSNTYVSESAALQEIVNGMSTIADEVGNGKIADPFSQQDLSLEESQFSLNSNADFANNIRSIRNAWLGSLDGSEGDGISSLVRSENAALDTRVRTEINGAIAAILAMTPNFSQAVFNNQAAVTAAQAAVLQLRETLESEVLPIVTGL